MTIPKIYILCGNATYNRGDRGNLTAQLDLLLERFPGADITIDSFRKDIDEHWYPVRVIERGAFLSFKQLAYLARADVVVWGGGALLADNACRSLVPFWFCLITILKQVLQKKIMAWAHGVVLETKLGQLVAKWTLQQVDMISVRDQNSYRTLLKLGFPPSQIHLTADPGITVCSTGEDKGRAILQELGWHPDQGKTIAVVPTFWQLYHQPTDVVPFFWGARLGLFRQRNRAAIANFIEGLGTVSGLVGRQLQEKTPVQFVLLPRYPGKPWQDVAYCDQIKAQILKVVPGATVIVYDHDRYSPKEYLSMYHCFDLVISVALHDLLFAAAHGKSAFNFYYEAKGKDFFAALNAQDASCPWTELLNPAKWQTLANTIVQTHQTWPMRQENFAKAVAQLQENAKKNGVLLAKLDPILENCSVKGAADATTPNLAA